MAYLTSDSEFQSTSSDSSLDDIEMDIIIRRPKIYKPRMIDFNVWSDQEFFKRFRLSKLVVTEVLERIRPHIEKNSNRGGSIKAETQVLLSLRYYATGNILLSIADFVGVSVASASRIIKSVSRAIAALRPEVIQMPETRQDLEQTAQSLYEIAHFPRCCGAIDCTHIRIISPGGDDEEVYRNRKGYFSLNVQTVSDASLKIRNIVARWPGSCHDQTIFNNSRLKFNFENGHFGRFHLIGDSGYAVKQYLLTPLQNTNTERERLYNEALIRTRNVVERQYGVWKRRFPILSRGIQVDVNTAMVIIIATAVLHNIAIEMSEDVPHDFDVQREAGYEVPVNINEENQNGHQLRIMFINEHFNI